MSGSIMSSLLNDRPDGLATARGQGTLVSGTATVASAQAASNKIILVTPVNPGVVEGILSIGTITPGVSFVVNSTSNSDNGDFNWAIF